MDSEVREPINIGSDQMVSINQMVGILENIAGIELEREYNLSAPKGVRGRNSENSKIRKLLGWEPTITLELGLLQTYNWIHNQIITQAKRS
jgi:nucleoside-diphosphate-sugar epimerase